VRRPVFDFTDKVGLRHAFPREGASLKFTVGLGLPRAIASKSQILLCGGKFPLGAVRKPGAANAITKSSRLFAVAHPREFEWPGTPPPNANGSPSDASNRRRRKVTCSAVQQGCVLCD